LKLECRGSADAILPAADAVLATFGVAKLGLAYGTTGCLVIIDTSSSCRISTELPTSASDSWLPRGLTEPWLSTDEPRAFADLAFGIACGLARRNEGQARFDSGPELTRIELTLELT
jgi:hypothetical protein